MMRGAGGGVVFGLALSLALLMASTVLNTLLWALVVASLPLDGLVRPRTLVQHEDGVRSRVLETVTVRAFMQSQKTDTVRTIRIDHYQVRLGKLVIEYDSHQPSRLLAKEQQSVRRLDGQVDDGGDAQVSSLTRVVLPLICVAIACLGIGIGVLLFAVLWRARHSAKMANVQHVPPLEPDLYGDVPPNETVTTTHDASAGTASRGGGGDVRGGGTGAAAPWGRLGFLDAVKLRKPTALLTHVYPAPWSNETRLPQVVHRPNLLAEVPREPSVSTLRHAPAVTTAPDYPPPVPLSAVSTMTNSFNEADDVMDLDLDAFLGLAASGGVVSLEAGGFKKVLPTSLSSIAESCHPHPPRVTEEIFWEGDPRSAEPQDPTRSDGAPSSLRLARGPPSVGAQDASRASPFSESASVTALRGTGSACLDDPRRALALLGASLCGEREGTPTLGSPASPRAVDCALSGGSERSGESRLSCDIESSSEASPVVNDEPCNSLLEV